MCPYEITSLDISTFLFIISAMSTAITGDISMRIFIFIFIKIPPLVTVGLVVVQPGTSVSGICLRCHCSRSL